MKELKELEGIIGEPFVGICPVCGNKHLQGGESVWWEIAVSQFQFYKWYCPRCGSTILDEKTTNVSDQLNCKGESVNVWLHMAICPQCGKQGFDGRGEWYVENGIEMENIPFLCPDCALTYEGKQIWGDISHRVYAIKDKDGRTFVLDQQLGEQGPPTK